LRWCIERELPCSAKSTHRARIEENSLVFDFTLSGGGHGALDALDQTGA